MPENWEEIFLPKQVGLSTCQSSANGLWSLTGSNKSVSCG